MPGSLFSNTAEESITLSDFTRIARFKADEREPEVMGSSRQHSPSSSNGDRIHSGNDLSGFEFSFTPLPSANSAQREQRTHGGLNTAFQHISSRSESIGSTELREWSTIERRSYVSDAAFPMLMDGATNYERDDKYEVAVVTEQPALDGLSKTTWLSWLQHTSHGWRGGLLIGIIANTAVLIVLLAFMIYCLAGTIRQGLRVTLYRGSCSTTNTLGTWLHLPINGFSTILLASGSYAMQCLTSPTRSELNKAHSRGSWMEIGVPGFHNLTKVSRSRVLLYLLTLVISLPIHLLANSAIFEIQRTNSYVMTLAWRQFEVYPAEQLQLDSQSYGYLYGFGSAPSFGFLDGSSNTYQDRRSSVSVTDDFVVDLKSLVPNMTRLSNTECTREYSNPLVAGRRHVIAISEALPLRNFSSAGNYIVSRPYYQSVDLCEDCQSYLNYTDPTAWTCAFTASEPWWLVRSCDNSAAIARAQDFSFQDHKISYCLSEPVSEHCELQTDIGILMVLSIVMLFQITILWSVRWSLPSHILTTLGDAVASFVRDPDMMTKGSCLLDRDDIKRHGTNDNSKALPLLSSNPKRWAPGRALPKQWSHSTMKQKWSAGPRTREWLVLFFLLSAVLIVACAFLSVGLSKLRQNTGVRTPRGEALFQPPADMASLWRMGFGSINVNFLVPLSGMSSADRLLPRVLLVNTPQVLLSFVYFAYNSVWTRMIISSEWAKYGVERRGLRVSEHPEGDQHSTYFLTIPYRFAIPLQIASAVLHWLLSQSFFLARIDAESGYPFVEAKTSVINTVGYSLFALILLIIMLGVLSVGIVVAGILGKVNSPLPIAGANSLIISAACHPPRCFERDLATRPLKWGVVTKATSDGTLHCSFSADEVHSPETLARVGPKDCARTEDFFS